jgi:hypothetical protein
MHEVELIDEKNKGQKSRETAPLRCHLLGLHQVIFDILSFDVHQSFRNSTLCSNILFFLIQNKKKNSRVPFVRMS